MRPIRGVERIFFKGAGVVLNAIFQKGSFCTDLFPNIFFNRNCIIICLKKERGGGRPAPPPPFPTPLPINACLMN